MVRKGTCDHDRKRYQAADAVQLDLPYPHPACLEFAKSNSSVHDAVYMACNGLNLEG